MIAGKLYNSKSGFGGGFGHVPFFDNEIICACGKKSYLETEASVIALLRKLKERITVGSSSLVMKKKVDFEGNTLQDIIQTAKGENTLYIALLQKSEKI